LCRDRTDQQNSTFITDAELLRFINTSYKELYNKIIKANSTYYMSEETINIVSNQNAYTLPTDFYKVQGVDLLTNTSQKYTAKPFSFENRNRDSGLNFYSTPFLRYIIQGNEIRFVPMPNSTQTATLYYIPLPITINDGAQTINTVNGGYAFLVADVCKMIATKAEDSNVQEFLQEKMQATQDIMENFNTRDEGMPETITDVYAVNDYLDRIF
jgi:acyl-coenzyme A thioesterase PaaI-like protein